MSGTCVTQSVLFHKASYILWHTIPALIKCNSRTRVGRPTSSTPCPMIRCRCSCFKRHPCVKSKQFVRCFRWWSRSGSCAFPEFVAEHTNKEIYDLHLKNFNFNKIVLYCGWFGEMLLRKRHRRCLTALVLCPFCFAKYGDIPTTVTTAWLCAPIVLLSHL